MTNQEETFDELNNAIGAWAPREEEIKADFPHDDPLPWPGIDEKEYPAEPVKSSRQDTSAVNKDAHDSSTDSSVLGVAVQKHGIEALAFYKSFRYRATRPYPGKWGVFFLEQGVRLVSDLISVYVPNGQTDPRTLGIEFLRRHEIYHYLVDVLALGIEPPMAKHLYLPFRHAYLHCPSHCIEEALANARALKWANKLDQSNNGLRSFAQDFMNEQPNAYRRYVEDPHTLNAELAGNLVDQCFGRMTNLRLATWMRAFPNNLASRWVPEYIIQSKSLSRLFPAVQIYPAVTKVVDSEEVQKTLRKNDLDLARQWEKTKQKLVVCHSLGGLDFKKWPPIQRAWSVRIDGGNRAHLIPITTTPGAWKAIEIGSHDALGH